MSSKSVRKYKDELPLDTINRVRNILNGMGILTVERSWAHSADGFYSVTISIANTTFSTNGKGTTYEYALASAYGELMERLQNQAPFRLNTDVSQETIEYQGFFYAPDEKQMSVDELLSSDDEWIKEKLAALDPNIDKRDLLALWQGISYEKPPSDFIAIPFFNLNSGKISYIPMKMVSKMYMSNGMCAGNTPEEALVQGISEAFERNVNKRIISERLTLPSIPREYIKENFPGIDDMMTQLESNGNFEVILKDGSLGKGFPVVGVIYINKEDQTYFIKFGAHPVFEIAAERTMTELLQGQDIKNMQGIWEFSYKSNIKDPHANLIGILVNGCGWYPNEFFGSKASYEFSPFIDTSRMNNSEMLKYLVYMLKTMGYDVFARNVSFLGLPSFHVIIPELSEIEEIDEVKELLDYEAYINAKRLLRNMENASNDELLKLADFLVNKDCGDETGILQLLNLTISKSLPWYYANKNLFVTALYCRMGDFVKASETFNEFIKRIKPNSISPAIYVYYKCMRDYLAARAEELTENEIIELLGALYPVYMVEGVIHELGNPELIFTKYGLIKCFDCEACRLKSGCSYKETERVFKAVKEKYAASSINQEDLKSLLN